MNAYGEQAGAESDFLDGPGFTAADIKPAGMFTGLNPMTPLRGIASGALEAGSVLIHGLPGLAHALSQGDQGDMSPTLEQQDDQQRDPNAKPPWEQPLTDWSNRTADAARAGAKSVTPDPRTTGSAANLVFGASKVLTEGGLSLAATAGNIPAAAATMGYISGMARYRDLKDQGVDEDTAEKLATTEGVLQGAGMVAPVGLPAKWIEAMTPVRQALTQLATGAAANAGQGVASRYITHQILADAGYAQLADQNRALDGESIAADLLSGAFFGGAHYMGQRPELAQRIQALAENGTLDTQIRDAAKVVQTERMASVDRAPGVPVDPAAQAAHQAALDKAIVDLLQDRPVNVSDEANGATFARPAEQSAQIEQLRGMMLDEFRNAGVAEEMARTDDFEAILNGKYGQQADASPRKQWEPTLLDLLHLPKDEGETPSPWFDEAAPESSQAPETETFTTEPASMAMDRVSAQADQIGEEAPKAFAAAAQCATRSAIGFNARVASAASTAGDVARQAAPWALSGGAVAAGVYELSNTWNADSESGDEQP